MAHQHRIRAAVASDYMAVCDLYRLLDAHHVYLYPEIFHHYTELPRGEDDYRSTLKDPSRILIVSESDTCLSGFAALLIAHSSRLPVFRPMRFVLLDNFFIREEFRGSGLAEDLFEAAKDWALSQGVSQMRLKTYHKNERATQFYERLGFRPISHDFSLDISP